MAAQLTKRPMRFSYLLVAATIGFAVGKTSHAWPNSPLGQLDLKKTLLYPLIKAKDSTTSEQRQKFLKTAKKALTTTNNLALKALQRLGLAQKPLPKTFGLYNRCDDALSPNTKSMPDPRKCSAWVPSETVIRNREQQVANWEEYERRRREGVELPEPDLKAVREMEQHDADMKEWERRKGEEEEEEEGRGRGGDEVVE